MNIEEADPRDAAREILTLSTIGSPEGFGTADLRAARGMLEALPS
jgi:hypothetical protein